MGLAAMLNEGCNAEQRLYKKTKNSLLEPLFGLSSAAKPANVHFSHCYALAIHASWRHVSEYRQNRTGARDRFYENFEKFPEWLGTQEISEGLKNKAANSAI